MTNDNPRYSLFAHLHKEHNLILHDSEIDEIINISTKALLEGIISEWHESKFQKELIEIIRERLNE
jgi:hypothetical protein